VFDGKSDRLLGAQTGVSLLSPEITIPKAVNILLIKECEKEYEQSFRTPLVLGEN